MFTTDIIIMFCFNYTSAVQNDHNAFFLWLILIYNSFPVIYLFIHLYICLSTFLIFWSLASVNWNICTKYLNEMRLLCLFFCAEYLDQPLCWHYYYFVRLNDGIFYSILRTNAVNFFVSLSCRVMAKGWIGRIFLAQVLCIYELSIFLL